MTTSSPRRELLTEARLLQRYVWGARAPRFALRRYLRLMPPDQKLLGIPTPLLRWGFVVGCLEPLPFIPRSADAAEFERRLFLALLVTEITPWGAGRSEAAAARSIVSFLLAVCGIFLLEVAAIPVRFLVHALLWMPDRAALDE